MESFQTFSYSNHHLAQQISAMLFKIIRNGINMDFFFFLGGYGGRNETGGGGGEI